MNRVDRGWLSELAWGMGASLVFGLGFLLARRRWKEDDDAGSLGSGMD